MIKLFGYCVLPPLQTTYLEPSMVTIVKRLPLNFNEWWTKAISIDLSNTYINFIAEPKHERSAIWWTNDIATTAFFAFIRSYLSDFFLQLELQLASSIRFVCNWHLNVRSYSTNLYNFQVHRKWFFVRKILYLGLWTDCWRMRVAVFSLRFVHFKCRQLLFAMPEPVCRTQLNAKKEH